MYALVGWDSPPVNVIPEVEIRWKRYVECQSLLCNWSAVADTRDLAIELQRSHIEWHEDGCPEL